MSRQRGLGPGSLGVSEALALLDEGALPAIAIDPRERVVRAVNGTLAGALGMEASQIEDEAVHAIVHEEHHDLVDAILVAIAEGANLGPTRVTLRPPRSEGPSPSLWSRVPGINEALGSTLVLLCQPYPAGGVPTDDEHQRAPETHPGYGRIPPSPPGWSW